jgi:hypothetical protein
MYAGSLLGIRGTLGSSRPKRPFPHSDAVLFLRQKEGWNSCPTLYAQAIWQAPGESRPSTHKAIPLSLNVEAGNVVHCLPPRLP